MRVACFRAPGVGSKSELTNAVRDSSVGDFSCKVFVACASGFSCGSEEDVLFLS